MKSLLLLLLAAPSVSSSITASEPADSVAVATTRTAEPADTLPDQFLKEVVVKSDRSWIEGNKAIFLPTKSEKNLANDAASLISRMNIPSIFVNGSEIKTISGKSVALFINGREASPTDLATFWPKLAKRVEYIIEPTDPAFMGAEAVINFIMTEYEVGGITKVIGWQNFPNDGIYNAASKLEYKKMTYGLQVNSGYSRDHLSTSRGKESFLDIYYNGTPYESIERHFEGHSINRNEFVETSLSADYRDSKWLIRNTASYRWFRNPESGTFDNDIWNPALFPSNRSGSITTARQVSPQFQGMTAYQINDNGFAAMDYGYIYGRSHAGYSYESGLPGSIVNNTTEDSHSATVTLRANYRISRKLFVSGDVTSLMNWYSTTYEGSANTLSKQWRGETSATLRATWTLADNLSATLIPGVVASYWHVNGCERNTVTQPKANANLYWAINSRSSISMNLYYLSYAPQASYSGNVLLRQTELEWMAGNPNLRTSSRWDANLTYMWMPSNSFNIMAMLDYTRNDNSFISLYFPASPELGGIVRQYANASPLHEYMALSNMNLRLFNNKVRVMLQPEYTFYNATGKYAGQCHAFKCTAGLDYTIGNCEVSCYYQTGSRRLSDGGMTRRKYPSHFDCSFSYGNGDFLLSAGVNNIFNSRSHSTVTTDAGVYSISQDSFSRGRYVSLRLSYTFGYGKKVDRDINISGPAAVKSGVLGSD